jgi:bifunctional non-homologous end joining protein LigD
MAKLQLESPEAGLSNPDKLMYPSIGFTKADVADYLVRISPALLPHLCGHPLSMKRYPNGVNGEFFFEKRCPSHHPPWVATSPIDSKSHGVINFCLVDNMQTLVWLANLACLELHTYLYRVSKPDVPTCVVFDLDPGEPAGVLDCLAIAQELRDVLDGLKLRCFAKTSGGKGLHLYVPINRPVDFVETKVFAHGIAKILEAKLPRLVTSVMTKKGRSGKIFIDWSQNDRGKTTVCAYSLRAQELPTVSTPVTWDEIEGAAKQRDAKRLRFVAHDVLERLEKLGDLFSPALELRQKLPSRFFRGN